jgi:hypothetical protein
MRRPTRNRRAGPGHRPAAPTESRRRIERVPVSENMFSWVPGELILGPRPRRQNLAHDVISRCQALYGRSTGEGEAE